MKRSTAVQHELPFGNSEAKRKGAEAVRKILEAANRSDPLNGSETKASVAKVPTDNQNLDSKFSIRNNPMEMEAENNSKDIRIVYPGANSDAFGAVKERVAEVGGSGPDLIRFDVWQNANRRKDIEGILIDYGFTLNLDEKAKVLELGTTHEDGDDRFKK
jgi:hypothetical protein